MIWSRWFPEDLLTWTYNHSLRAAQLASGSLRACSIWLMSCWPSGGEIPMRSPTERIAEAGKQQTRTPTVSGGTCAASTALRLTYYHMYVAPWSLCHLVLVAPRLLETLKQPAGCFYFT